MFHSQPQHHNSCMLLHHDPSPTRLHSPGLLNVQGPSQPILHGPGLLKIQVSPSFTDQVCSRSKSAHPWTRSTHTSQTRSPHASRPRSACASSRAGVSHKCTDRHYIFFRRTQMRSTALGFFCKLVSSGLQHRAQHFLRVFPFQTCLIGSLSFASLVFRLRNNRETGRDHFVKWCTAVPGDGVECSCCLSVVVQSSVTEVYSEHRDDS